MLIKSTFITIQFFFRSLLRFDEIDMKLLFELSKDGNISVPMLSKKLGVNASVLYSRIKRLVRKKVIKKFTIEIDDSLLGIGVKASVGINRDPKFKMQIHKNLLEVAEVVSISEVTGRFDIIIRIYAQDLEDLHTVVIEKIGKIDGIQNTETFVELQKTDKELAYLNKNRYEIVKTLFNFQCLVSTKLREFTVPLALIYFNSKLLRSFSINFNS